MSKLTGKIERYAHTICKNNEIDTQRLRYAGVKLESATAMGVLQSDIVFQMQHTAHMLGKYINQYIVINVGTIEDPIYTATEAWLATDGQLEALNEYYQYAHRRLKEASDRYAEFCLVTAVRSALFNREDVSDKRRLTFANNLVTLDEGVTVINHNEMTMLNLVTPNKLLHIDNAIDLPREVQIHEASMAPE